MGAMGRTPLSWPAGEGQYDTVALLLRPRNASSNKEDKDCQTPLSSASRNEHDRVVGLLLEFNLAENLLEMLLARLSRYLLCS